MVQSRSVNRTILPDTGGGGVIEGGGAPKLGLFLSYVIPAVIGSYIIFGILLFMLFKKGVIHFG